MSCVSSQNAVVLAQVLAPQTNVVMWHCNRTLQIKILSDLSHHVGD